MRRPLSLRNVPLRTPWSLVGSCLVLLASSPVGAEPAPVPAAANEGGTPRDSSATPSAPAAETPAAETPAASQSPSAGKGKKNGSAAHLGLFAGEIGLLEMGLPSDQPGQGASLGLDLGLGAESGELGFGVDAGLRGGLAFHSGFQFDSRLGLGLSLPLGSSMAIVPFVGGGADGVGVGWDDPDLMTQDAAGYFMTGVRSWILLGNAELDLRFSHHSVWKRPDEWRGSFRLAVKDTCGGFEFTEFGGFNQLLVTYGICAHDEH